MLDRIGDYGLADDFLTIRGTNHLLKRPHGLALHIDGRDLRQEGQFEVDAGADLAPPLTDCVNTTIPGVDNPYRDYMLDDAEQEVNYCLDLAPLCLAR